MSETIWIVTLVHAPSLAGVRSVDTYGPYDSHAEAHRARVRIFNAEIYGRGDHRSRDQVFISQLEPKL